MPFSFQRIRAQPTQRGASLHVEPPDKRRRTGSEIVLAEAPSIPIVTDDDWGESVDDDLRLTADQLEELDFIATQAVSVPPKAVSSSTRPEPGKPPVWLSNNNHTQQGTSTITKPSVNNFRGAKVQTNVPLYNPQKCTNSSRLISSSFTMNSSNTSPAIINSEIQRISAENEFYKSQIAKVKEDQYSSEGEIRMLRQMLAQKENDLFKQKQNQCDVIDQQARDHVTKRKELDCEVEKLRSQLQFKDQEIHEYNNKLKRLEQAKSKNSAANDGVAAGSSPVSPRLGRKLPQSPKKVHLNNCFPTAESFCARKVVSPTKYASVHAQTDEVAEVVTGVVDINKTLARTRRPLRCLLKTKGNRGCLTGPGLVSKLQLETTSGVYKLIEMCQADTVNDITIQNRLHADNTVTPQSLEMELRHVAQTGLAELLSRTSSTAKFDRPLTCDTSAAVSLIPLISLLLDKFVKASVPDCNSRLSEQDIFMVLDILRCLVSYSADVRNAILESNNNQIYDRSESEQHRLSPVPGPSGDAGRIVSSYTPLITPASSSLQSLVVQLITKLLPQESEFSYILVERCVNIMESLASQASAAQLESFLPVAQSGVLSECLLSTARPAVTLAVVRLLRALVQSNRLITVLCKHSAHCTFYCALCQCAQLCSDSYHQTALCEALVELVSGVVSLHKGGVTFLQETDCLCSEECAKSLIVACYRETRAYLRTRSPRVLRTLRKGLMLLYQMSVRGLCPEQNGDVEMQYTDFVNTMFTILKTLPDVADCELTAVQYLWDFEDDSGQEDEAATMDIS